MSRRLSVQLLTQGTADPSWGPHQVWPQQERRRRLRYACGSPRSCVECYLQERARRIERWREAGTPEVGIFYVIGGELWIESTPLPEARQLREVIIHFRKHRSYWRMFRQASPAFHGLPHTCYPRGRVAFVKATGRYHVYVGPELLTNESPIWCVIDEMHLPTARTEVRLAPHFRTQSLL